NMKGLVTFDRKTKKDSYFWYKANWSEDPVLYLTQRRNNDREKKITSVTVYSNIGTPTVYLNDKELTGIRKGYTDVHYVFDEVTLADGLNILKAVVTKDGKPHEDTIEWTYTGEKKREADTYSIKGEHWGF
ncbi:beta-galactosidase, partial [Parabacteroides sp. OttesenSCG-928-G06]|nr:beta-galactosidase [Parabacteroides sp. OttesenSCG-928-G06]